MEIPAPVKDKAVAAGAGAWLDALPSLVEGLEADWAITVQEPYPDCTEAFVARAQCDDGSPCVLKVIVPRDGDAARREIAALQLCRGQGCVQLLRADVGRSALLLERLGPSLFELGLPIGVRHEILYAAAQQIWRPAPDSGFPTGADKARWLMDFIVATWEEVDHPCSEEAVDHALACAERRVAAHDDERAVLVHGDVHQWNALQAQEGFKLVDPDGLVAEAEYDLGILMREDPVELIIGSPMDRAAWLARRTGLDAEAIWEWGVVERVSTGLLCTQINLQPVGRQMLYAADAIAREVQAP